jgi:hypothetical protein
MSGGAPVPQPVGKDESRKEAKILCIADLEAEGSRKLPQMVRGKIVFTKYDTRVMG